MKAKRNRRNKKHPEYYAIKPYQKLKKLSDEDVAAHLGITKRTYNDKINGYSDFTNSQGEKLAEILGKSQSEIFLI